jgi:hypothetical protein
VIVDCFYDVAVSGADPIEARPGCAALLARIADNGSVTKDPSAQSKKIIELSQLDSRLMIFGNGKAWHASMTITPNQLLAAPGFQYSGRLKACINILQ